MKKLYGVEITDTAWYEVEADSPEDAQAIAEEWFSERTPKVHVEEIGYTGSGYNPGEK